MANAHPLEKYLLDSYRLQPETLSRVGLFLLGHLLIDQRLIAAVAAHMVKERAGSYPNLTLDEWQAIVEVSAERTFVRHLKEARDRQLLSDRLIVIAEEAHRARDTFLHFGPNREHVPTYRGCDVTTEEGLRVFLDDLLDFLNAMPFPAI